MMWLTAAPFQQIIFTLFFTVTYVMIIASRGLGKSQIVASALCVRCILYPGSEVIIAAGVRGQSLNVIKKIVDEFMPHSPNLRNEIEETGTSAANAFVKFKNGSIISTVAASKNARSARAHLIVVDEFALVEKDIVDTVLRRFKAGQRTPNFYYTGKYTSDPNKETETCKYVPKDQNSEIYTSSASYKSNWSWGKFNAYAKSMLQGQSYCVCGFPYELPVSAGYHSLDQIQQEMQESDFNEVKWSMEMDSLFFGESENAFFSYSELTSQRKIVQPLYPIEYYGMWNDKTVKYPVKKDGEIRILSADIATAGGSKNDATAITVIRMIPNAVGQYTRYAAYMETIDGGLGAAQAIRIHQLYDDMDIDYVGIDTNGTGLTVYDALMDTLVDDERGITYDSWSCRNNKEMAARSKNPDDRKVIISIKADAQFNSDCAVSLRSHVRNGKLQFLVNENDGKEWLEHSAAYQRMSPEEQALLQHPFIQITLFINETINLDYEVKDDGKIRVKEQGANRKDRYSSMSYANKIADEIELENRQSRRSKIMEMPACVSSISFD